MKWVSGTVSESFFKHIIVPKTPILPLRKCQNQEIFRTKLNGHKVSLAISIPTKTPRAVRYEKVKTRSKKNNKIKIKTKNIFHLHAGSSNFTRLEESETKKIKSHSLCLLRIILSKNILIFGLVRCYSKNLFLCLNFGINFLFLFVFSVTITESKVQKKTRESAGIWYFIYFFILFVLAFAFV